MTVTNIGWFTTSPHPWKKAHTHGADDGQVGWKLHAVPVDEKGQPQKRGKALCGIWPKHGWGMDAFIDAECTRCAAAITKRETAGESFFDLPDWRGQSSHKAFCDGNNAAYYGKPRTDNPHPKDDPVNGYLYERWLSGYNQECPEDSQPESNL